MAPLAGPPLDTWNRVLLGLATLFSLVLILAAVFIPAYNSGGNSLTGNSATIVQQNGDGVLGFVCIPLAGSIAVAVALMFRLRWVAWVFAAIVCCFVFLGAFTIGVFGIPVALLLVVACARAQAHH